MKQTLTVFSLISATIIILVVIGNNTTVHSKSAGALFPKSCTSCHIGTVGTTPNLSFKLIDTATQQEPTSFNPGETYAVEVKIYDPVFNVFGYTLAADTGHFYTIGSDSTSQVKLVNGEHATHTKNGIVGKNNEITWRVYWRAPVLAPDTINLNVYVLAADGDSTEKGDATYHTRIHLTNNATTGLKTLNKLLEAAYAYPNPATNELAVSLDGMESILKTIDLLDIRGILVSSVSITDITQHQNQYLLNISNLTSGIYFLHINSSVGQKTLKVLIK